MPEKDITRNKQQTRGENTTLCKDIPEINFSSDNVRIEKKSGEKGLTAFLRWSKEQADSYCSSGLCSKGKCRGQRSNLEAKLLNETDEYIEVSFRMTINCKCE